MALSPAAQAAKAKLDAELAKDKFEIDVKLGAGLYAELLNNGYLPQSPFEAVGLGHIFPHTSYKGNFAFWGRELDPYDFRVGDGGHVV